MTATTTQLAAPHPPAPHGARRHHVRQRRCPRPTSACSPSMSARRPPAMPARNGSRGRHRAWPAGLDLLDARARCRHGPVGRTGNPHRRPPQRLHRACAHRRSGRRCSTSSGSSSTTQGRAGWHQGQFLFFVMTGTYIVFSIGAVVFLALTTMRALFGQFGPSQDDASLLPPCSGMRSSCTGSPDRHLRHQVGSDVHHGLQVLLGLTIALAIGVIAYGCSTGGEHVGPVTLGWKAWATMLATWSSSRRFASACFAGIIVAFRDADPAAQSHYMGVEAIAPTTPVTGSFWPVACSALAARCSAWCSVRPCSSWAW